MFEYHEDIFVPKSTKGSPYSISLRYYEDKNDDLNVIQNPTIQSQIIRDEHIELFIPYNINDNDSLRAKYPDIPMLKNRD
jgi:hypothetical protein